VGYVSREHRAEKIIFLSPFLMECLSENTPGLFRGDMGATVGAFRFFQFFADLLGDYSGINRGRLGGYFGDYE